MSMLDPEVIAFTGENPGETLRCARENKNWSQTDVAVKLNLTVQALVHLESGAFAKLPGNTFARGYIRTYAKLLGIDQEPLVVAFDQLTGSNSAGSSVHALGRIEEPAHVAQNVLRVVSLVLLVGLAVGSYLWWQDRSQSNVGVSVINALEPIEVEGADGNTQIHPLDEPEDQAVSVAQDTAETVLPLAAPELAAETVAAVAAQSEASLNTNEAVVSATPPSALTSPVVSPSNASLTPASSVPVLAQAPVSTAVAELAPQTVAGDALVGVQFTANCWAQLTDANGKVLFSALKRAGESIQLAGKPPLELRLGYARGAQVSFNGQNIDVAPYTSGETARIKLGL
jgi:cytoskeleton protein RodZ